MDTLSAQVASAHALVRSGQASRAIAVLQRLAARHPTDAPVLSTLAYAYLMSGDRERAMFYSRRALDLQPDNPRLMSNLGLLLVNQPPGPERDSACTLFERALAIDPRHWDARVGVVNFLMERRQWARAEDVCRAGLEFGMNEQLAPSHAAALVSLGRLREAMELLARATHVFPDNLRVRSGLATTAQYLEEPAPAEIARLHRDYGRVLERTTPVLPTAPMSWDDSRPLRVGLMSPDLRRHSVAYFIEPFVHGHDRSRTHVVAFMTSSVEDEMSAHLRGLCDAWHNVGALNDEEIARKIRAEHIDILIDLAGHTQGQRLAVLARRPAPVQVTYIGYPDTTGLTRVDWRVVDSHTDPPGAVPHRDGDPQPSFDERATERLLRLDPCFLCYRPARDAPSPHRTKRDHIVFGSFNAARKISQSCADLWSMALRRVPGSGLLLKATEFDDPACTRVVMAMFERAGVADRVRCVAPTGSVHDHLAMYAEMDVALDTFPYHGTTTTCEALWMGVPVVTLAGDRHASRVGVSLLHAVGRPEWIGGSREEFVEKAVALAGDARGLDELRTGLRERVGASALCNERAYVERFERGLREMHLGRVTRGA